MDRFLTKSKFKLALECPTKLYYHGKAEYQNNKLDDEFLKALAKGGFQVGELAKYYYPNGIEITGLDHDSALRNTQNALKSDGIIYEAAFSFEHLFIRSDIVMKSDDSIHLIEVKAKSIDSSDEKDTLYSDRDKDIRQKWKPFVYDVAFQKYVVQKAYPELKVKTSLLLVDKSKTATVDGLNQKFLIQSGEKGRTSIKVLGDVSPESLGEKILIEIGIDDLVDHILSEATFRDNPLHSFEEWINIYSNAYKNDERIWSTLGGKCAKCEFYNNSINGEIIPKSGYHECWRQMAEFTEEDFLKPSILRIHDFRKKDEYISHKKYFQENLTRADLEPVNKKKGANVKVHAGLSRVDRQEIQITKSKDRDKTPYIDKEGLRVAISSWKYPLHFIDFETTMVALPFNAGRRPYEQIAFQFSHHIMLEDGTIEHKGEWLNSKVGAFPNFEFVRELRKELRDSGSIFRYAAHENSVLNAVYRQLKASPESDAEELCEWIKTISKSTNESLESWQGPNNMIDLKELIYAYYYSPLTEGSNSIKEVLPAILNTSDYLKSLYDKPIYGSLIRSRNFKDQTWIKLNKDQRVTNPYDLLSPIFEGISNSQLDNLLLDDDAELNDGGCAMMAYAQMQFTEMSEGERNLIRKSLLQYCELDTLAMVMIVQELMHLASDAVKDRETNS